VVRGVAIVERAEAEEREKWPVGREQSPDDNYEYVTMNEVLKYLNAEDEEHHVELDGELCCEFLDSIIPTDRMRAGAAPCSETGVQSKHSEDDDWESSSDVEADEEADEETGEETGEEIGE
jgi:hypothetical protein